MNFKMLLTFLVCSVPLMLCGRTFYVSPGGNDSLAGTSIATAWQNAYRVNDENLEPGDTILFQGGHTYDGGLYLDAADAGNAAAHIRISSYGGSRATLATGASLVGIYAYNCGFIDIDNINVIGPGKDSTYTTNGIFFFTDADTMLHDITINNVEVTQISGAGQGIMLGAWHGVGYNQVSITNCEVHDGSYFAAIYTYNGPSLSYLHKNIYVAHCNVYNDSPLSYEEQDRPCMGNGILLMYADSALVERCVAHDGVAGGSYGIWGYNIHNSIIQHCEAYGFRRYDLGTDGGGFDIDGASTNNVIQYCYSHDNAGAGYLLWTTTEGAWGNNTLRYNISYQDGDIYGGITTGGFTPTVDTTYIYNNTVIASPHADGALVCWDGVLENAPIFFMNNIICDSFNTGVVEDYSQGDAFFLNNLYHNAAGSLSFNTDGIIYEDVDGTTALSLWRTATGQEMLDTAALGMVSDPGLSSVATTTIGFLHIDSMGVYLPGYQLLPGSPCINTGYAVDGFLGIPMGLIDFYGNNNLRSMHRDIGAAEFQSEASFLPAVTLKGPLTIYPNPAKEYITLSSDKAVAGEFYLIRDNAGRCMSKGRVDATLRIYTGQLSPGVFTLELPYSASAAHFIISR